MNSDYSRGKTVIKRLCREIPQGCSLRLAWNELVRHIKIVTDPNKVDQLNAELARRKTVERGHSEMCRSLLADREEGAR
jgi:hypothetical protein